MLFACLLAGDVINIRTSMPHLFELHSTKNYVLREALYIEKSHIIIVNDDFSSMTHTLNADYDTLVLDVNIQAC